MSTIGDVIDYLHSIAPNHLQEDYDNAGLIVGKRGIPCTGVVVCLDSTEAVIDEAIQHGANMVVAHHPIVFKGLKRFNGTNYVERVVMKAIAHDIAIFAIHTNLDNVLNNGVNEKIAQKIGLESINILAPKVGESIIGSGVYGVLPQPMREIEFLVHLKECMEISMVKYTSFIVHDIEKVAVCGGSGGFLLSKAKEVKADIFITSDYKYHEYFDANGEIIIADIGHYESEKYTIELLYSLISQKFSTFAARCTEIVTNPIKYL